MAIIRILKWMPSVYDETQYFKHVKFHDWTTAVATTRPVTHIRVCHQCMCIIIPTQFIYHKKVILDKGAIIIIQIKEVAKWSNRGNL